jgi:hypothetical protein
MEALACREGLSLAMDLNLQRFRLACDNKNVIRSLSGMDMGAYGHVVREIKARASVFIHSEFVHENRASNVDAHVLARSSIYAPLGRHVWFIEPPDGICSTYTFVAHIPLHINKEGASFCKKKLCRSCKIPFISCATSWCLSNLDSVVAIERKIEQSATPTTSEALQKRGMDRAAEGIHGPAAKRAHGHSGRGTTDGLWH